MLKNFKLSKNQTKTLEVITLEETLNNLNITREQLIDIALLVGTDFNEGVYGIGAKRGLKLIQKYNIGKSIKSFG